VFARLVQVNKTLNHNSRFKLGTLGFLLCPFTAFQDYKPRQHVGSNMGKLPDKSGHALQAGPGGSYPPSYLFAIAHEITSFSCSYVKQLLYSQRTLEHEGGLLNWEFLFS
jgi:hypothetical protein